MHPSRAMLRLRANRQLRRFGVKRAVIFQRFFWAVALVVAFVSSPIQAQETAWIQVEAYPRLVTAQERAESYGGQDLPLAGYQLGTSGWYALALGPFPAATAEDELSRLIELDLIPRDSFLSDGATFESQFWPESASAGAVGTADSLSPEDVAISLLDDPSDTVAPVLPNTTDSSNAAEPEANTAQTVEDAPEGDTEAAEATPETAEPDAEPSPETGETAEIQSDAAAEPAEDTAEAASEAEAPVQGTAEDELEAAIEAQEAQLAREAAEAEAAEIAAREAAEQAAREAAEAEAAAQAAAEAAAAEAAREQAEAEAAAAAEIQAAAGDDSETAEVETLAGPPEPDETVEEARASERELSRAAKELIQTALQWEGFYDANIDGDYGRITRRAMSAWQESKGIEPTGVLTTAQRAQLLADYNAILDGLGLAMVTDEDAGIAINLPTALVQFDRYVPPFAHYEPLDPENPTRVILISQEGDQASLFGLYDIMQTLEIVPPEGLRERKQRSFRLKGADARIVSETYAEVQDGAIKGYTLIWPVNDEKRRLRVLENMRASFTRLPGVLPDVAGEGQSVDLVAGLKIRRPAISRSGFYVDGAGAVLTTTEAVDQCERITLDSEVDATVSARDDGTGLALLSPATALSPSQFARFRPSELRLQSEVSVAGYSYEGVLGTPTMTFGQLADVRGLNGDEAINRLALSAQPGDVGGPVFDNAGSVIGMMQTVEGAAGQQLPPNVSFATDAPTVVTFLSDAGATPAAAEDNPPIPPEDLTRQAISMTVLVSCWR